MSSSGRTPQAAQVPSAQRLGFALFRVGLQVARVYEAELAASGLRHEHAGILLAAGYGGPIHIRALARHLGANRQTIVNAVDFLQVRRAVERVPSDTDARVVLVRLTPDGHILLRQVEAASARMDARLAEVGTAAEREAALGFLHAIAESVALGERIDLSPRR